MGDDHFETFVRGDGLVDWRLVAANGDKVCTSHEQGFRDEHDARRAISRMIAIVGGTEHLEVRSVLK